MQNKRLSDIKEQSKEKFDNVKNQDNYNHHYFLPKTIT